MSDSRTPTDRRRGGAWRRLTSRLTSTQEEIEAAELQADTRDVGAQSICDCVGGEMTTVCGTIRSVTLRPRAGVPAVEAEIYDGSGRMLLVFLGRRRISGIEAGRTVVVSGRLTCNTDEPRIFNPRYQLMPVAGE